MLESHFEYIISKYDGYVRKCDKKSNELKETTNECKECSPIEVLLCDKSRRRARAKRSFLQTSKQGAQRWDEAGKSNVSQRLDGWGDGSASVKGPRIGHCALLSDRHVVLETPGGHVMGCCCSSCSVRFSIGQRSESDLSMGLLIP
ncbi:hypothetical protein NPIL_648551 [Nephila pilipes]|uniref:Uncharacterized protein n=1 Tax=Nephila pilipes TaxID=299642 RepID=A0A8X6T258_NEPPI|nr:hypothetical protein NPIL_648551 [Nephila pilipes]